jgi:hypothetical protein
MQPKPIVPASPQGRAAAIAIMNAVSELLEGTLNDLSPSARADVEGMPRNGATLEVVASTDLLSPPRLVLRFVPADTSIPPRELASVFVQTP